MNKVSDWLVANFDRSNRMFYLPINCPVLGLGGQNFGREHSVTHQ